MNTPDSQSAGGTRNELSGTASIVIQGRDFLGGIHLNPPPFPSVQPAPRQLPPDITHFTGRRSDEGKLDEFLTKASSSQITAVVISAIAGTAGVGKTALAVHWAHRVRANFPDGQLYV